MKQKIHFINACFWFKLRITWRCTGADAGIKFFVTCSSSKEFICYRAGMGLCAKVDESCFTRSFFFILNIVNWAWSGFKSTRRLQKVSFCFVLFKLQKTQTASDVRWGGFKNETSGKSIAIITFFMHKFSTDVFSNQFHKASN